MNRADPLEIGQSYVTHQGTPRGAAQRERGRHANRFCPRPYEWERAAVAPILQNYKRDGDRAVPQISVAAGEQGIVQLVDRDTDTVDAGIRAGIVARVDD